MKNLCEFLEILHAHFPPVCVSLDSRMVGCCIGCWLVGCVEAPDFLRRQHQETDVTTNMATMQVEGMEPSTQAETAPQSDNTREGTATPPEPTQEIEEDDPHISMMLDAKNSFMRHKLAAGSQFAMGQGSGLG